jgi:hypothetical protein
MPPGGCCWHISDLRAWSAARTDADTRDGSARSRSNAVRKLSDGRMHPSPRQSPASSALQRSSLSSEGILDAANGILDLPFDLVGAALSLKLCVADKAPDTFLDRALRLLG